MKVKKQLWCAVLCLNILPATLARASGEVVVFKNDGKEVSTMSLVEAEKLSPIEVKIVYEPHEKKDVPYRAMSFNRLMDKVYGDAWRKADEVLVTCMDGYQPSIPVQKFLKFDAWLAVARTDQAAFQVVNSLQNNEVVGLGPLYFVWDDKKSPQLKGEGAADHPYQVVGIDLIRFQDRFPKIVPNAKSSAAAKRGFLVYRKNCMTCHSLNGEGGSKAPELNIPVNVTEYWREDWLVRWITNPLSVRANTTMPAFADGSGDAKKKIADLMAYLKAMKSQKITAAPSK